MKRPADKRNFREEIKEALSGLFAGVALSTLLFIAVIMPTK